MTTLLPPATRKMKECPHRLVTFKLTFEANLSKEARLDNTTMLWALGAYFVYITIWLARFLMKFRKPRDA